jgi:hypothetical protein
MSEKLQSSRAVRSAFWRENPGLDRRKIPNYSGNGTMYRTDTRCAFTDWVDAQSKEGRISQRLAESITLSED